MGPANRRGPREGGGRQEERGLNKARLEGRPARGAGGGGGGGGPSERVVDAEEGRGEDLFRRRFFADTVSDASLG